MSHAVAFLAKGNTYFSRGRFYEARDCWKQALKLKPTWAITWYNLGLVFARLKKRASALRSFQQALKRDPSLIEAYVELALLYEELGQLHKARQKYNQALRIAPASPIVNYNFGSLLFDQGLYAKALVCFRRVLSADPAHAPSYDYVGFISGERNQRKQEIQAHERAALLEPWNAAFINNLGYAFLKEGRLKKALRCFNDSVQLDQTNDVAYYNCAHVFYLQKNIAGVIKNLALAIRYNPAQRAHLRKSKDFGEVRKTPAFKKLLDNGTGYQGDRLKR